jgi:acyl-CoA synthetase (AMP-forming)/AMP-acid ligase II
VLLYNSKEYVEIVLALSTTGAILVPLNFRLSGEELEFILKDSESETLVFDEEFTHVVEAIKANIPIREGNYIRVGKGISSWAIHYEKTVMVSSLRCCFTGGERVPPSLLKEYLNKGITISQCYGQTESFEL